MTVREKKIKPRPKLQRQRVGPYANLVNVNVGVAFIERHRKVIEVINNMNFY